MTLQHPDTIWTRILQSRGSILHISNAIFCTETALGVCVCVCVCVCVREGGKWEKGLCLCGMFTLFNPIIYMCVCVCVCVCVCLCVCVCVGPVCVCVCVCV